MVFLRIPMEISKNNCIISVMIYHFKHMRTKFVLAIGLPMLVIFCVMAFTEYRYGVDSSINTIQSHMISATANLAMQLNEMFVKNAQIAQSNGNFFRAFPRILTDKNRVKGTLQILKSCIDEEGENPELFGLTAAILPTPDSETYAEMFSLADGFARPEVSPYVWRDLNNPLHICETDLTNQEGVCYSLDHWRQSPWFKKPYETQKPVWSSAYIDDTPGLEAVEMVTYSVPVFIEKQFRAVCTVDISLNKIRELIDSMKPPMGYLILVTPEGEMLYHPEFKKVENIDRIMESGNGYGFALEQSDLNRVMELVKKSQSGLVEVRGLSGNRYAYWNVCQPIPETGWSLIHVSSEEDVLQPVIKTFRRQSLVFMFILVITLIILSIVSSLVTHPLEEIDKAAELIIKGDFSVRLKNAHSEDEAGRLGKTFNHMLETLKSTVDQKAMESAARRTIENDVTRAREIQAHMLPDPKSMSQYKQFDIFALNLPARFVAGDFYDFWMLDANTLAVVVADVCGKGTPAAMFMAMSRTILRGVSDIKKSPAQIIQRMNEILNHSNDQMFVTIFYGHYNITTGRMVFSNGGHLPPVLRHVNGETEECDLPFGFPVGIIPDAHFDEKEFTIQPGELLCIYTDGVSEATADQAGEKELFGASRICDFIQKEGDVSPETLCGDLAQAADSFRQSERQDDITVLTIKRTRN